MYSAARFCGGLFIAIAVGAPFVSAEEPLPAFRRVFAPADRAQDWPFHAERYLPIPATQFEQAVRQAQQSAVPPAETAVVDARLNVRFDGRDRLTGQAVLTLRPAESGSRLVPLAAGSVPLVKAVWRETNTPAVLGNTPDGATAVWVERPGTLVCQWSAVGIRDAVGGIVFDLQTPSASASSLSITLPASYELQDAAAVRTSPEAKDAKEATYEIRPLTPRRRLRIVSARAASAAAPRYALRQDADYEYSERGFDLTMQLRIDAVDEPLAKLDLEYDPGLTIVDARLPDRRLTWTDQEPVTTPRRATIEFNPPLFGSARTVLIRALATPQIGKRYALPTLRFPNLDWRQGTLSLAVAAPLVIDRIDPISCVAAVPTPLAGGRIGEAIEFTCFDPKASLRVLAARQRDAVEATGVTTVSFADDETKAEHRVELRVTAGERFLVQAAVPTKWIVDSVTSTNAGEPADWTLSEIREKHRWLTIRLAQALKPDRPIRLTIAARAKRPAAGATVGPEDLRIVDFRDARSDAPIAAVRAADSWRLQLEREREETAPSVERLDPLRRELLGEFVPEFLLDLRETTDPWELTLDRRAARIEATIAQTAFVAGDQLTETYRIKATDQDAAPLERLEVRFAPSRPQSLSWSWGDDRSGGLQARRLTTTAGNSTTSATQNMETWEIVFPTPQSGAVQLQAVRRSTLEEATDLTLAAVVDSTAGSGTIAIESDVVTPLAIDRVNLTPLPTWTPATEPQHRVRGLFRYDPAQSVVAELPRRPSVHRLPKEAETAAAVVWNARQQTIYEADGRTTQRAHLRIQSFGGESFRWSFSRFAEELSVRVNDVPVETRAGDVIVPLPPHSEFVTVMAEYVEHVHAIGPLRLAVTPTLQIDLPVLHVDRDVRLPPHYAVLDAAERSSSVYDVTARLQRLVEPWSSHVGEKAVAAAPPGMPIGTAGPWQSGGVSFARGLPTSSGGVWLARSETTAALQFSAAALACVVGLRYLVRRRRRFWIALGIAAALATVLPPYLAALVTWCCYGLLTAAAIEITLPRLSSRKSSRADGRIGTVSGAPSGTASRPGIAMAWPIVLALTLVSTTAAQSPSAATPDASAVFIPVGNDGKPTGERYQVPERLWKALEERVAAHDPTSLGGAVLTDADYTAVVAHDARRAKYLISEFRATWNMHIVAAPTEAAVPFSPFEASSTAVLIDGRPVDAVRTADGRRLRLAFDQTGPHRVEVIVRTATLEPPLGSGTSLSIPRVNDGRIRVTTPPELVGLAIAEAAETPVITADHRTFTARLMPSDTLTFAWMEAAAAAEAVEFEQYEWWRVRPGSVTVDLKLHVVSPTAGGREITLLADPRLQWLPRRSGDAGEIEVTSSPLVVEQATVGQRLRITLPETLRPDGVVEATFLLNGAQGIGRMRLPELRLERRPAQRRLFAVSVDPSFDFVFAGDDGFVPVAIPEFERVWGTSPMLPQAAFELRAPRDDWSLTTRPKPTRLTAVELQMLTCGRRRVDVAYEAEIAVTGDAVTRHELSVPVEMEVASVSVVDSAGDGEEHVLRFARDDQGAVIVLLRTPLRNTHKLTLRGRWNVPTAPADIGFPFVQLRGTTGGERRLRLVRLPEANVELLGAKNLQPESSEPVGTAVGQRGRLVGVWRVSAASPSAKLKITANSPRIAAQAVSTLRRELQTWEYELVVQLDVTGGVADEIRLDFPAAVALPLTVIPTMPYEAATLREEGRRQLVLHPRDSIKGKFQFALRGGLTSLDREHPVPYVRLRGTTTAEYYFQLPVRSGVNRVAWDVDQLAPAPLPGGFSKPTAEEMVTYRALGPRPTAALQEIRRGTGRPTVRLADHRVRTSVAGDEGVSIWFVEPSGATEFLLRMPSEFEVLAVRSGGADIGAVKIAPGTFRVPAASEQMPHLIEAAYRRGPAARLPAEGLVAPELETLPIERTLWTIVDDEAIAPWPVEDAATAAALQTLRAQVFTAAVSELTADQGLGETQAWIEPLERRRRRATGGSVTAKSAGQLCLDEVWDVNVTAAMTHVYVSATGAKAIIARPTQAAVGAWRIWPAPLACLLVAGLLWLGGRCDGLWRWSPLCGVLIGLAWSVWLQPAFIGWIILIAVFGSRLHGSLREARERRTTPIGAMRVAR